MTHKKIKIIIAFLFLATAGIHAQGCYQLGVNNAKNIYNQALRLKNSGDCENAAQQFFSAFKIVQATRDNCSDIPVNHELGTLENNCITGIIECKKIIVGDKLVTLELKVAPQALTFDEKGGNQAVTVTTNAESWSVVSFPSWCTVNRSGSRLTVNCSRNDGTSGREGMIAISANKQTEIIRVTQTGKALSCYQTRMNECTSIYNNALRLKNIGDCDEAARQFVASIRRIKYIRKSCTDIPANQELDTLEKMCETGIEECNLIPPAHDEYPDTDPNMDLNPVPDPVAVPIRLEVSDQTVTFGENGGKNVITVGTNAGDWTIEGCPSWCSGSRNGDKLTVTCEANAGINRREGVVMITAKGLRAMITIRQAGKTEIVSSESKKEPQEYLPFYVGITAGPSYYGSLSIGKTNDLAMSLGVEAAYFFNEWIGAGLKFNQMSCDLNIQNNNLYREKVTFFGPSLFGNYGLDRGFFKAGLGVGLLNWNVVFKNSYGGDRNFIEGKTSKVGAFISIGYDYMLTQNIGIGLNVIQTTIGSITNDYDIKRNPTAFGCTLGINFRF